MFSLLYAVHPLYLAAADMIIKHHNQHLFTIHHRHLSKTICHHNNHNHNINQLQTSRHQLKIICHLLNQASHKAPQLKTICHQSQAMLSQLVFHNPKLVSHKFKKLKLSKSFKNK